MLRTDGKYQIYLVEFLSINPCNKKQKTWHSADYFMTSPTIPWNIRMTYADKNGIKPGYYYKSKTKEPFKTFSASGQCWQETGIFGSFSRKIAENMCDILRKYFPKKKFRVSILNISQEIRPTAY